MRSEIYERLANSPHLEPVFEDVHDIGRRLREIDDTLFIVRNHRYGRFEVHCLEHRPNTIAWAIPWDRLDVRTVRRARRNSILNRGDVIFKEMDRHNEKLEASIKRQNSNDLDALARETKSLFAPLAWEM